ncbi:c-type cytochrome biogenesis protein CcsB [Desulfurella sp.]|uniref:c-type cytochrome biogenesis protein CcsB n=2 Tax=Desulfurella sp. TaxID=1962857 RepID=UPI0025B921CC|nr:c-type cytochrome biogenesis protein CcsB [Desulfurella sp.]
MFISISFKSQKFQNIAKFLFLFSFLENLTYFFYRWNKAGHIPVTDAFTSFVFFALCVGLFQVLFLKKSKSFIVLFSSILISFTLFGLSIAGFSENIEPLIPALKSNWLAIHVITSFLAYAAFSMNFLIGTYILYTSKLKSDYITGSLSFSILVAGLLTSILANLLRYNIVILGIVIFIITFIVFIYFHKPFKNISKDLLVKPVYIGFPLLTTGIITGSIWAKYAWGGYWSWDPKEIWSLITWIVYLIYIHYNIKNKSIRFLSYLALVGFVSIMITYLGVNFIMPGLHSYASK